MRNKRRTSDNARREAGEHEELSAIIWVVSDMWLSILEMDAPGGAQFASLHKPANWITVRYGFRGGVKAIRNGVNIASV